VPATAFVDRAAHTTTALGVMLRPDQHFGLNGWVFTGAVAYGLVAMVGSPAARRMRWHLLLAFVVPFGAAWWWLASYEARFLMLIVPTLGVMGALALGDLAAFAENRVPSGPRLMLTASLAALIVATAMGIRKTVEHKEVLLRRPLLGDADRHRVRLGSLYDLAIALNALPPGSRLGDVPRIIGYHVDLGRFRRVDWAPASGSADELAARYDYVVVPSSAAAPLPSMAPVAEAGDYRIYATDRGVAGAAR
jgi:hypothetical protein